MDLQDLKSLQILEEIGSNHSSTQRGLATKLNMSLGLVNSFIKRLAIKGYVKITSIPRNRLKYILTPKGFAEKSRLTYEFIHYSLRFYKKALMNLQDVLAELETKGVKKVVFYGSGDLAEIAFISLRATGIKLAGIVDDARKGQRFLDFIIKSTDELKALEFDRIIMAPIGPKEEHRSRVLQQAVPEEKIIELT